MVERGTLDPCTCLIFSMHIIVSMDITYLTMYLDVVPDYVDFICIFVSGSGSDCCEFIWQQENVNGYFSETQLGHIGP